MQQRATMSTSQQTTSEGSPSPSLHSSHTWEALRHSLPHASNAQLDELLERYAWNVVWPALAPSQRKARIAMLSLDDKRLLLDLLFQRMVEKLGAGADWQSLP